MVLLGGTTKQSIDTLIGDPLLGSLRKVNLALVQEDESLTTRIIHLVVDDDTFLRLLVLKGEVTTWQELLINPLLQKQEMKKGDEILGNKVSGEAAHEAVGMRMSDVEIKRLNELVSASASRNLSYAETEELSTLRKRQSLRTGPRL